MQNNSNKRGAKSKKKYEDDGFLVPSASDDDEDFNEKEAMNKDIEINEEELKEAEKFMTGGLEDLHKAHKKKHKKDK